MPTEKAIPPGAFQCAGEHTCFAWVGDQGGNGRNCYTPAKWLFRGEFFCTRHVKESIYWPMRKAPAANASGQEGGGDE